MRGFAGLVYFDGPPAPERLETLTLAMAVGPFERMSSRWLGAAGFVHLLNPGQREEQFEAQPLADESHGILLATDARLENREELAVDLQWTPHDAIARADSEFIFAAYARWGEACVTRLEGRWALAVWDKNRRQLFAATDPFSFRPLYYFRGAGLFAFASTLRGLLALPEAPRTLNPGVLADEILGERTHPGETLYRGISAVPAAHWIRVDPTGESSGRYWQAEPQRRLEFSNDADCLAAFQHELRSAVAAGLRSAGKTAVLLSGGLDSAAVTAVAGRLMAERGERLQALHQLPAPGGPRFRGPHRELDESAYVRRMQATMPHIDFHFLPPRQTAPGADIAGWDTQLAIHCVPLRAPAKAADADPAPLATLDFAQVLLGSGGNYAVSLEAYPSDYFLQLAVRWQWRRLWHELAGHARFYGRRRKHLVYDRILQPLFPRWRSRDPQPSPLLSLLHPDFIRQEAIGERLRAPLLGLGERANFSVKRRVAWVLNHLMPQNVGAATAVIGAGRGAERFQPLASRRLNAFCLAVPIEQHIRDGKDRLLLRRAMLGQLPDEVVWRTTRGFAAPAAWSESRTLLAQLPTIMERIERSPLAASILDVREMRRLLSGDSDAILSRLSGSHLSDLLNVGWFLSWLGARSTAEWMSPGTAQPA